MPLYYDAIQLIFNELEFPDLLSVAETSGTSSYLAARSFKQNFAHMKIRIGNLSYSKPPNRIDLAIQSVSKEINRYVDVIPLNLDKLRVEEDSIQIKSVFYGLKTLKHFGKFIRKLELSFENVDTKAAKIISKYVDDYCLESLIEFGIEFIEGDGMKLFKKPFNHVEKFTFAQKEEKKNDKERAITLPTNKTFPALRSFSFEAQGAQFSHSYMNCHFPHLEHLSIIEPPYRSSLAAMKELVEINSHIRSFKCDGCEQKLMHFSGATLVKVENLSIDYFYTYGFLEDQDVRFANVRKAELNSISGQPQMSLPKLQDLKISFDSWRTDILLNFLDIHGNLSRLHLIHKELEDDVFEQITLNLSNLEEISISQIGFKHINCFNIIDFMQEHKKLKKFQIDYCTREAEEKLRDSLKEDWNIQEYINGLSLQRKN